MNVGLGQGNLGLLVYIVSNDVVGFSTTGDEKKLGLKELLDLLKWQKEQSAEMGLSWKIKTLDIHISPDENTSIFTNDVTFYITMDANTSDVNYLPKLSVRTRFENGKVLLSFEDKDPGIPNKIKDKILQPFFTTKKSTQGTDQGLRITNDIIQAHGGALGIQSDRDGSIFSITLNT